jgi:hypothetical protein
MVLPSPILARKDFGSNGGLRLVAIAGGSSVAVLKYNEHGCVWFRHPDGRVSSCFSGEVDPPLGEHELGNRSMLSLLCERDETSLSYLVHFTEQGTSL